MTKYGAYPAYKPSNVAWLGDIPEHWNVWKVTHGFSRIGSGTTPKSDNPVFYDGNVPWVTTSELRETIITDTMQKVSDEAVSSYSALKIYPEGSLAIAMYGATIGRLGMLGVKATFNQACCVFAEPTVFDMRFIYYWLWMRRPILISLSNGGGQPNLSQDDLKKIWVPIPDVPEQKIISRFLDYKTAQIDALIAKQKMLLDKLAEKRTALISHAVTKGLDPAVPMKASGVEWLGEIPAHWVVKRFKFCLSIQNGRDYKEVQSSEGYPVYGSGGQFTYANQYLHSGEAVLLGRKGTIDKPLYVNEAFWTVDTMYYAIPKIGHEGRFLYFCATLIPFHLYSTDTALPSMTQSALNNHLIAVPPEVEQKQIVFKLEARLKVLDAQREKANMVIDRLLEYRSALITNAVTGKIDVRHIPIPMEKAA